MISFTTVVAFYVLVISLCSIVGYIGYWAGTDCMRRKAIKAGVAHYRCNPRTGICQFVWVTSPE